MAMRLDAPAWQYDPAYPRADILQIITSYIL
jgi:hypothetical protein